MNGQKRSDIKIGGKVKIVLKADQPTGRLTEGLVARILTNSSVHPHGIKVMLSDGQVGRVQELLL
ncbi:MAG: YwbE family protein [Oscillospiraceae bacterium]